MVIYSHSKLATFEQCKLKYKYRYIDKIVPDIKDTIERFLGSKVHDTLEWIYKNAWEREIELDDVIEYYAVSWNRDYNEDIVIVKEGYDAKYYFNKGIRFLVDYFQKHKPFRDNTLDTERKIFVNLDNEGKYRLIGYIDRLVHHKDTNIFEIHDYKTGSLKSQEELDKDRQLALYSIGVRDSFNATDVHLIWHFLDYNKQVTSKRTPDQLELLKNEILRLIEIIESTKEFEANPGCLCKWCEYKIQCPFYEEAVCNTNNNNYNGEYEKENNVNPETSS